MLDQETLDLAQKQADQLAEKFMAEVKRLLLSGAVDQGSVPRNVLFGVAMENIADGWLWDRSTKDYRNLKMF